jgi:hypothetical protein
VSEIKLKGSVLSRVCAGESRGGARRFGRYRGEGYISHNFILTLFSAVYLVVGSSYSRIHTIAATDTILRAIVWETYLKESMF